MRVFPTTHDSGVAIIDDQMRIFVVNSVNEPVVWSMHNCEYRALITEKFFDIHKIH